MASTEWSTEGFVWSEPTAAYVTVVDNRSTFGPTSRGQPSSKGSPYSYRQQKSASSSGNVFHRNKNGPERSHAKGLNQTRNNVFAKGTQVRILKRPNPSKDCDNDGKPRHSTKEKNGSEEELISGPNPIAENCEGRTQQECHSFGENSQFNTGSKQRRRGKGHFKVEPKTSGIEAVSELEEASNLASKDKSRNTAKSRRRPRVGGTVPVFKDCCKLINKHLGLQAMDEQCSDPHGCHHCGCDNYQKPKQRMPTSSRRYQNLENTGTEPEECQISTESSENKKPRRARKASARQNRREKKNVNRNESKLLTRNDVLQQSSGAATNGCSEVPSQSVYSSQEESSNTELNDVPAGCAEIHTESQSSQQEVMESVLHLLELISQNPTQPTSDPSFPTSNAPVVSSSMQPAVNGSDPAVARESSSYDSLNHVVQTRPVENVWFLPKVQDFRRNLSMLHSSSWVKQNVAEGIHSTWRNSNSAFFNRWFAAAVSPWENGVLGDRWGTTESLKPPLVEERYSRSYTGRKQTHDWRDRWSNVKDGAISVRSVSPRAVSEPENAYLPCDASVPPSDTEYSLGLTSERNPNGEIDRKVDAGECMSALADVKVEAGSGLPVPAVESVELQATDDLNSKTQVNCSKEDVDAFIGNSLRSLEDVSFQVDRVLRVMIDFLHPDGRSMQGLLGLNSSDFYRLCSFYSRVNFERLDDLEWEKVDIHLVEMLLEHLLWLCRSLVVGMLAKEALLVEDHIDFARLDLDLSYCDDLDEHKEIDLLLALAEDLRCIPQVQSNDRYGWFTVCQALRDIVNAFDANDRPRLRELGVVDTAERVSERIVLGMSVSADDVMNLLRDSMNSGFGEYIWLVENHPQLIGTMDHVDCIMDSIPLMTKCVDIRPLHRTLTVIPRFLSQLGNDERDSWVGKNIGRYQSLEAVRSWLQLIRNAEKEEDLALELTVQFFFCSVKCGAEEFLGALLDKIPLEKKVIAIKSIELMPHSLHSTLIPDRCASTEGGLYEAVQRMTEEMPVTRFKSDGVFIIEQLCEHCSLSPSRLLSEVFFPMMSTATKGKSAIAICSLVKQEAFRKEVLAGSTVSTTDLVTFALKHYEPPVSSASTSKYLFIETVLRAVDTLLRENESLKVDFNAILDDLKSLKWYHAFVILSLFFHDAFRVGVSIKFPWRDELSACNTVETFCEIPLILTSWPGDNSNLFESFIIENFGMDDADMLSRSMLLALDRSGGRLDDFLPIFSSAIQKLRNEERDWERFLLEEEFKYQDVPHAQVFDCTGISFGFFDDDNQGVRNWLNTGACPDEPVEIVGKAASLRVSSLGSVNGPRQNFSAIASSLLDVSEFSSVFLEESPRISSTAPDMYMLSKSDSCVLNTTEASKEKPCERLVGIKNSCISRPGGVYDDVKPPERIDAEQCMATMLNEICKEFGEYCAASTLVRIADGEVSHEVDLNISAITSGSDEVGDDSLLQTIPSGSRDSLLNSQQSFAGMNGADVESADEKTCTNLSSDWDEVVSLKEEPAREHVLLELRTFTWALDTIEEWDECPVSVRTKVLRLALESRCSVIKKRAQQLRGSDMED